jgi:hypothetical protein
MTTTADRRTRLARYRDGAAAIAAAAAGLSDDELDRRPAPGEWTAREVIHHLADAEVRSAIRLRQLLAEEAPVIEGYDEGRYAQVLHYDRPVAAALAVIDAVRASTAELLDCLTDADFARVGTHTELGSYSVDTWLGVYADHALDHADQLRRAATGS